MTPAQTFSFFHENVLGTSLDLQIESDTLSQAQIAEERVLGEIDRLESIFNRYDPRSEFRRWQDNPGIVTALSPELFHVLEVCEVWKERSAGAFDPAGEAFLELWRESAKNDRLLTDDKIAELRTETAKPTWRLNPQDETGIRYGTYRLSLNSVAKGFIIDCAGEVAMHCDGVRGVVVNIGGDLVVRGEKAKRVGVTDPFQDAENTAPVAIVSLQDRALATSGNGRRGFQIDGKLYSHLIDPRTGRPAAQFCSASVRAPDAMTADILATVFSIWSPAESIALADTLPGVGCLLIDRDGKIYRSRAWRG